MGAICFSCEHKNDSQHAFCSACGSPLSLSIYVSRQVDARLNEATHDRELIETHSAVRVFEKAYGWAKLVGGIAAGLVAVLIAGATWQSINLRSTVSSTLAAVGTARASAEKQIGDTASTTRSEIESESSKSAQIIRSAAKQANDTSSQAQLVAKTQGVALTQQANEVRREFHGEAVAVTKDVASARQQIQAASQLQPKMLELQQQLSEAQSQIEQQQKILVSSEDFAKKVFSSHKQILWNVKQLDQSQYAIVNAGKNRDGVDLIALYLLIPNAPIFETLTAQIEQTLVPINSINYFHNVVVLFIQKPAQTSLLRNDVVLSFFPDPSDKTVFKSLTIKDNQVYATGQLVPLVKQDSALTAPTPPK